MHIFICQVLENKSQDAVAAEYETTCSLLAERGHTIEPALSLEYAQEKLVKLEGKGVKNVAVYKLSRLLNALSKCDAVFFCPGWTESRYCWLVHEAAMALNVNILGVLALPANAEN